MADTQTTLEVVTAHLRQGIEDVETFTTEFLAALAGEKEPISNHVITLGMLTSRQKTLEEVLALIELIEGE